MPVFTSDALILRTYKLGEADRIVVFLTKDRGKKRGVAKGARRARSRFSGALEPLTRAGVAYYERELRDLVRINYVEPQRSPLAAVAHSSAGDAAALGHAEYFAELIDEWAPEAHADERLYRLGSSVVDAFAAGAPTDRLARYFEFWLLRLQGVYPQLSSCPECGGRFDGGAIMPPRDQHYVCRRCASGGGTLVSIDALHFLRAAASASPDALGTMPLESGPARELEIAHRRLIHHHLEKELKSARVLRQLR